MHSESPYPSQRWDIFCRVIDNFGDIGVCWRLACNLAERNQTVRLWVDDLSALTWLAPQGAPGIDVRAWTHPLEMSQIAPGDVLLEAFGCEIDIEFIASYVSATSATGQKSIWINLEYLSAEDYVSRCHGLPSPVMSGPGRGLTKHFFYPGFTAETGGLLRESNLLQRQADFDPDGWLSALGINWHGKRLISLFCYEPDGLDDLLESLAADVQHPSCLLVTPGRASAAVRQAVLNKIELQSLWNKHQALTFFFLPQLTQMDYDHLLWSCDINFVRGEDSLVRALWAGKPLIWQIYPQHDGAHGPKLDAFLTWLQAPASLRRAHNIWNGLDKNATAGRLQPWLAHQTMADWKDTVEKARKTILTHSDLAHSLIDFVSKTH